MAPWARYEARDAVQVLASPAVRTLTWILPPSVGFRVWSSTLTESKKLEPSSENSQRSVSRSWCRRPCPACSRRRTSSRHHRERRWPRRRGGGDGGGAEGERRGARTEETSGGDTSHYGHAGSPLLRVQTRRRRRRTACGSRLYRGEWSEEHRAHWSHAPQRAHMVDAMIERCQPAVTRGWFNLRSRFRHRGNGRLQICSAAHTSSHFSRGSHLTVGLGAAAWLDDSPGRTGGWVVLSTGGVSTISGWPAAGRRGQVRGAASAGSSAGRGPGRSRPGRSAP